MTIHFFNNKEIVTYHKDFFKKKLIMATTTSLWTWSWIM